MAQPLHRGRRSTLHDPALAGPGRARRPGVLPRVAWSLSTTGPPYACRRAASVAGVWSGPPFGVLALRPVALQDDADVDTTVSAQRLLEALTGSDRHRRGRPARCCPPRCSARRGRRCCRPRLAGRWRPRCPSRWYRPGRRRGRGLPSRVDALPADGRTQAALEAVAEELWRAPSVGPVPMRAAHAASQLGFLGRDGVVTAYRSGGWVRLGCPGGSVLARLDEPARSGDWGPSTSSEPSPPADPSSSPVPLALPRPTGQQAWAVMARHDRPRSRGLSVTQADISRAFAPPAGAAREARGGRSPAEVGRGPGASSASSRTHESPGKRSAVMVTVTGSPGEFSS